MGDDLDLPITTTRWLAAQRLRDWVHDSPLSQCHVGADTCPDWPLAWQLADVALGLAPPTGGGDDG